MEITPNIEPYNDESITNTDILIRRVDPKNHLAWDHDRNCERISSKCFSPGSASGEGMSIDLLKSIESAGLNPKEFVTTPKFRGAVCLPASSPRSVELSVGKDPIPENLHHGQVWRVGAQSEKFTKRQIKELQRSIEWFVELPDVILR